MKEITPGAGEYDPSDPRSTKITGGDSMFKNNDDRFKKSLEAEQLAHVGPGSYAQGDMTLSQSVGMNSGKVSSAFASTTLRDGGFGA